MHLPPQTKKFVIPRFKGLSGRDPQAIPNLFWDIPNEFLGYPKFCVWIRFGISHANFRIIAVPRSTSFDRRKCVVPNEVHRALPARYTDRWIWQRADRRRA